MERKEWEWDRERKRHSPCLNDLFTNFSMAFCTEGGGGGGGLQRIYEGEDCFSPSPPTADSLM